MPARHAGIDALRAGTTLLVVLHHTAITYGAIGGWYYKEILTDGSLSSMLLVFFCTLNQAWFMGLFFLLAGYYTPAQLQSKGSWKYLRDRLQRLGIPLLVYGFVIGPATIALAQTARGKPFPDTLLRQYGTGAPQVRVERQRCVRSLLPAGRPAAANAWRQARAVSP